MVVSEKSDSHPPRKVGLSCAECRRSKLKCDRVFPCQSCVRRGCASICPEGILPATKGNKVLMAHAQELSKQVKHLTMRVRELEELLEMRAPHLLKMKIEKQEEPPESLMDSISESYLEQLAESSPPAAEQHEEEDEMEHKDLAEALGSLAIGQDGQMRYRGVTAGAEYLQDLLPSTYDDSRYRLKDLNFPPDIVELAIAFPFGLKDVSHRKPHFLHFIPAKDRALQLFDIYYEYCSWMYNPIAREMFIRTYMDPIYGTTGIPSVNTIHSHKLSVFFILLANGALYDEASGERSHWWAARYLHLARAALSLDSMLTDATVATCEALFMMIRFIYNSDRSTNEERWLITGLAARVAQMIGLQRDSGGWSLPDDEVQRRRSIFWDIWTWDTYTAIVNGRPGCLGIQHTDCKLPEDLFAVKNSKGVLEPGYQTWRTQYCVTCLTASSDHVFAIKTPPYSQLLQLDKMLRSIIPPEHLWTPANPESPHGWPESATLACEQACARFLKESHILYIHRSYFAQAIRQNPDNPFAHKYAPSVYAVITSARTICQHLHGLYARHRKIVRHGWYFWTSMYSSCIVLSALVVECPGFSLAPECFLDLRRAFVLYEEGSRPCRSESSLVHIQQLVERAGKSLEAYRQGRGESIRPLADPSQPDALDVLGGRKTLIVPKSNSNSPTSISDASPRSAKSPPIPAPVPMPSQAGAAELFLEYCQLNNAEVGQGKFEAINYLAAQPHQPQTITYTPSHVQTHIQTQPQYPLFSGEGPLSPNSTLSNSNMLTPSSDGGYPRTPHETLYSPQFETPHMFGANARPPIPGPSNSWHPQSQLSMSNGGQFHQQQPHYDGNAMVLGYTVSTSGHQSFPQQHQQQPCRNSTGGEMSQSDIWSNFSQQFLRS